MLSVLLSNSISSNVNEDSFIPRIFEVIQEMKRNNSNNVNAILTGSRKVIKAFQKSESYKPYWELRDSVFGKLHGYEGNLGETAVFYLHELEDEHVIMVDLKKIGFLNQYRVKEDDVNALH